MLDRTQAARAHSALVRGLLADTALESSEEIPLFFAPSSQSVVDSAPRLRGEAAQTASDHDALTGMPGRRELERRLTECLALAHRSTLHVGVMFLDVDDFKSVNDAHGHCVGDRILQEMGARMLRVTRTGEMIGRFGGDEFVAILPSITDRDALMRAAERIEQAFEAPFEVDGKSFGLRASIGVVMAPENGETQDVVIERADAAMYRAKERKSGICWYDAQLDEELARRREMQRELGDASVVEQMFLGFEPVCDIETDRLRSAEALVRWRHPRFGVLTCSRCSDIGMLPETVESWAMRGALARVADWRRRGVALRITVNVGNFGGDPLGRIFALIDREKLEPHDVGIEIAERVFAGYRNAATAFAARCSEGGIAVTLDEYSGLLGARELSRLPIRGVKIAQNVVDRALSDESAAAVVASTAALAKVFGIDVTAMGAHGGSAREKLAALGVGSVQGRAETVVPDAAQAPAR